MAKSKVRISKYIAIPTVLLFIFSVVACGGEDRTADTAGEESAYAGKWGYIDKTGNMVIEPRFDCAWQFSEGLAPVNIGRQLGYVDKEGNMAIEPQFPYWQIEPFPKDRQYGGYEIYFNDGLARIEVDGRYGFIDKNGDIVIEPVYEEAYVFCEGLASVYINGKWGYIDTYGNMVLETEFDGVGHFSEGLASVWDKNGIGFINTDGEVVIGPRFLEAGWFSEDRAVVTVGEEFGDRVWGYIDTEGNWAVGPEPFTGEHLLVHQCYFSEGLALFRNGHVDRNGNIVIEGGGYPFSEGLALVAVHNEDGFLDHGFIDREGNQVIEPRFEYADSFSEGLALVKVNDRYGFIDESGGFIIEPIYEKALSFSEGLAPVLVWDDSGQ